LTGYGNMGSTIFLPSVCDMVHVSTLEQRRMSLQANLDAAKTKAERNRLGQFATPTVLAREILQFGVGLLKANLPVRFLDPALGTGSFFSALLHAVAPDRIESAKGYELDTRYIYPARFLYQETSLDIVSGDFTRAIAPLDEKERFNLLICNPPYVRHHHIVNSEKDRLRHAAEVTCGMHITGLAGLYCYFLCLSHAWLMRGAVSGWLIPSEFMDVNYGTAIKQYLLDKVTLLRIHRFDPNEVQFDDALVSSAIVWFRNDPSPANQRVEFTFGGSLLSPTLTRAIDSQTLREESKWTRFPNSGIRKQGTHLRLSDLFTIKRGIATGDNAFFILSTEQIKKYELPPEVFRPILPSPRYVKALEIIATTDGLPQISRPLFLLDCRLQEEDIHDKYPTLWKYLEKGRDIVSSRYLCRSRKVWYSQELRPPAPILFTYMGRQHKDNGLSFRFILNHSQAVAANVYLLLYPKPPLAKLLAKDSTMMRRLWQALNAIPARTLVDEGRVYGGGLYKLEPKELGNVAATSISEAVPIEI